MTRFILGCPTWKVGIHDIDKLPLLHHRLINSVTGALPGNFSPGGWMAPPAPIIKIAHLLTQISLSSAASWTSPPTTKDFLSRALPNTRWWRPIVLASRVLPLRQLQFSRISSLLQIPVGTLTLSIRLSSTDSPTPTSKLLFRRILLQNRSIL